MFLFEKIGVLAEAGYLAPVPPYIEANLNPRLELRPYQRTALQSFITYFEAPQYRQYPSQTLFHMATGSGKTLIMAALLLYLYQQGYRNFLFFVNLTNIVEQTKENFLNPAHSKYLFGEEIAWEGRRLRLRQVTNFQDSDPQAANLCFTTIQGLHSDLRHAKENGVTWDDFANSKLVLFSDEAHHLNVTTKRGDKKAREQEQTWEDTVGRLLAADRDNVLLEFTATCDLAHPAIHAAYEDKIICDYPLRRFREDGYSKEIKTLRSDLPVMEKALQAVVLSQYRLRVFQAHRLAVKPVVLFKAAKIAESRAFQEQFGAAIRQLDGAALQQLAAQAPSPIMQRAYAYFAAHGVTWEQLAQELREEFGPERCLSVNDDGEAAKWQLQVNTLEAPANPYRAIFEVKKLDEGWDVLNLFDIVRLYETRQSGGGKISPATVAEAQLIGRGARYCPFQLTPAQSKYQRKYDQDLAHPLRVCEELYYHCQNDSRYIAELTTALQETGLMPRLAVERCYQLKESFQNGELYQQGVIFLNSRQPRRYDGLKALLPGREYAVTLHTGRAVVDTVLAPVQEEEPSVTLHDRQYTWGEIAAANYSLLHKALRAYPELRFSRLKTLFPQLRSSRQFLQDPRYLGGVRLVLTSRYEQPGPAVLREACTAVLGQIARALARSGESYSGSTVFTPYPLRQIFGEKWVKYTDPHDGGEGISQNDWSVVPEYRLDLSREDWYAYTDHFGNEEEKAFIAYFHRHVGALRQKFEQVVLLRNERQAALYSFAEGRRFEPDFCLLLSRREGNIHRHWQVFIEPKGNHLLVEDQWKEEFLLQLAGSPSSVLSQGEDVYTLMGLHFFNREQRQAPFGEDMARLLTL